MSRQRLTTLVIVALLALGAATYLSARRNTHPDDRGTLLFPTLAGEVNSVSQITVRKGSANPVLTLHKQGAQWTVAERADYPADLSKLRRLLLALTDAKIVEEKTSNPASYPVIGVEDPTQPGASGAQVDITAADVKHGLIVGKSSPDGSFVRRAAEASSYSVSPAISVDAEPRFWIDTKLLDLATSDIQKVDVKIAGAAPYSIHRVATAAVATAAAAPTATPTASPTPSPTPSPSPVAPPADFVLEGVPAGRKSADPSTLSPSPTTYSNLGVDDVAPADSVEFDAASLVTVTLTGGKIVALSGVVASDKHWIKVATTEDLPLSAKSAGRAFEISNYRYDAIFRPLEKLLVPKPPSPHPGKMPGSKQPITQSSPNP